MENEHACAESQARASLTRVVPCKGDKTAKFEEMLQLQSDAMLKVLESWLASQEDRLSRLWVSREGTRSQTSGPLWESEEVVSAADWTQARRSTGSKSGLLDDDAIAITTVPSITSSASLTLSDDVPDRTPPSQDIFEPISPKTPVLERRRSSSTIASGYNLEKKLQEIQEATVDQQRCKVPKAIVAHPAFEGYFAFLILVNACMTAVEVQLSLESVTAATPPLLVPLGHMLGFSFLFELVIRVAAQGRGFLRGPGYGWNLFDGVLVGSWTIEFGLEMVEAATGTSASARSTGLSNMRLFRILRITRMFRLLRIARILRFVRALNLLVMSIVTTLRSLVWASILMLLIIFTFAIFIGQSIADSIKDCQDVDCTMDPELKLYWGTLPRASLSLFQVITGGKDWDDLARPLMERSQLLLFILVVFITFSQFAVLNVVTGVFCQAAVESAQRDRELMVQSMLTNKQRFMDAIGEQFTNMFKQFSNGAGGLTLESFEEHVHVKSVREYFALLELDTSDAWMLFQLLDDDGSGSIDVEEFVDGCLKLKGTARSIDLARLSMEFKHSSQRFEEDLNKLRDTLRLLDLPALSDRASATVSRAASKGLSRAASKSSETIGGLGMGADTDIKDIVSRPQEYLSV
eukprot:TRINITY_DN1881_c0_g1_i5.p1 TRINITY_DN1881_c0_g1~~TRINITY_DN1881_c0_g1_i5.p1  ORF type:complete len:635 (+),score=80.83 TRINITY_DN1881_c0_g1_i5:65-1969(+)